MNRTVKASVDLKQYYDCEMDSAELVVDGDTESEYVRFRWEDAFVDVPVTAVERAFNVVCRDSRQLGPRAFGLPT